MALMTPANGHSASAPQSAAETGPRIFISAAEPSGDRHAADLIRHIRRQCPAATFFGLAGPLMRQAGCQAIDDFTDRSAMLLGAVSLAKRAWLLVRDVGRLFSQQPPDLAILVDSPALHLPMAKKIKAGTDTPILYYIAPQLWAWAPGRIRKVRRWIDRMAVILPFEEEYFRSRGVEAEYVGHPLVEQLQSAPPDSDEVARLKKQGQPVIACLPGSRRHVIEEVLPGQVEVCQTIARQFQQATFLFVAADERAREMINTKLTDTELNAHIIVNRNAECLAAADLALCASGTATLEVAWYRLPMVVMYNGSKWGYRLIGRFLIRTPHLSLANILAGRRIVPEFMPYYTSTTPIATEAIDLLSNAERYRQTQADLNAVIERLGTTSAADRTAAIALEMIPAGHAPAAQS